MLFYFHLVVIYMLVSFLPDEEWERVSSHRYCWFHSEVTNHSGEILAQFIDESAAISAV